VATGAQSVRWTRYNAVVRVWAARLLVVEAPWETTPVRMLVHPPEARVVDRWTL
jgi:hypothetical protein